MDVLPADWSGKLSPGERIDGNLNSLKSWKCRWRSQRENWDYAKRRIPRFIQECGQPGMEIKLSKLWSVPGLEGRERKKVTACFRVIGGDLSENMVIAPAWIKRGEFGYNSYLKSSTSTSGFFWKISISLYCVIGISCPICAHSRAMCI